MGVLRNRPSSLFIAILANQPKKNMTIKKSSIRTTTAREGISANLSSGERSMEKISITKDFHYAV